MIRIFRAKKMLDRLDREGRTSEIDPESRKMIELLDGEEANDYNWESVVNGENLALISATDKHPEMYVNVNDCD